METIQLEWQKPEEIVLKSQNWTDWLGASFPPREGAKCAIILRKGRYFLPWPFEDREQTCLSSFCDEKTGILAAQNNPVAMSGAERMTGVLMRSDFARGGFFVDVEDHPEQKVNLPILIGAWIDDKKRKHLYGGEFEFAAKYEGLRQHIAILETELRIERKASNRIYLVIVILIIAGAAIQLGSAFFVWRSLR